GIIDRRHDEAELDSMVLQRGRLFGGRHLQELDADTRIADLESLDGPGDEGELGQALESDGERAHLAALDAAGLPSARFEACKEATSLVGEYATRRRQLDAALIPQEEGPSEFVLKPLDRASNRRLRNVKPGRSASIIQLVSNREKVPQLPQLHCHSSIPPFQRRGGQ